MGFGPVSTYAVDFPLDIVLHPAALAKYQVCPRKTAILEKL